MHTRQAGKDWWGGSAEAGTGAGGGLLFVITNAETRPRHAAQLRRCHGKQLDNIATRTRTRTGTGTGTTRGQGMAGRRARGRSVGRSLCLVDNQIRS